MKTKSFFRILPPGVVIIATIIFLLSACSKSNNSYGSGSGTTTYGQASLSVTNASPTTSMYAVYADSTQLNSGSLLGYGMTSGTSTNPYYTLQSGQRRIRLTSDGGNSYVIDSSVNLAANGHYSVFAFDTAQSGKLKTIILNDNLTAPPSGMTEVRFLNLSPNSPLSNVLLINGTDTTSFNSVGYVGNNLLVPDSTLSAFRTVTPGTYTVVINNAAAGDANLFKMDSLSLASGGIYTLYSKGYVNNGVGTSNSDTLGVGVIRNY
jgi:hypothetical protein